MLFHKEISDGKLTPDLYLKYKLEASNELINQNTHTLVINQLIKQGLENKIPSIFLYDMCILEEAG